ncbi:hypothetical protein BC938DRAFT_479812 [Jimgerdemannia flammicorona]|uniref:Uncharacterized protein n=1 Tax=Jimgerdemannia flammicorona TaxID=994334 RepID=A0A433QK47_9FUNG|nr:hypothetical protein BC938DRAFT_479812 [Jimgerdemannia flammicorona]
MNLSSESGSTVLHPNWIIPSCVTAGSYKLTFHEIDVENNNSTFFEFSIPISVNVPSSWPSQKACTQASSVPSSSSSSSSSSSLSSSSSSGTRVFSGDLKTLMTNAAVALLAVSCLMIMM